MLTYISYDQLRKDVESFSCKLPDDIVGVIGIPRSGMLAASMLALHRDARLYSLEEYAMWGPGIDGRVLLLDDSHYRGKAMSEADERIGTAWRSRQLYGAIYASPNHQDYGTVKLDYVGRIIESPRYFAWNLFKHDDLKEAMLDLDGVMCPDPPMCEDQRDAYIEYIRTAPKLHIPTKPVGAIATMRLEKYRSITEEWLARHGVKYGKLHMSPCSTPEERRSKCDYGEHKGRLFRESSCKFFIESSASQSPRIASVSGKPVTCIEDQKVYQ